MPRQLRSAFSQFSQARRRGSDHHLYQAAIYLKKAEFLSEEWGAPQSNIYDPGRLYDAASTIMQQKLSQIEGVGQVFVGGSSLPAVRVDINPTQLNSYGLGLADVKNMLNQQNSNL